LFLTILHADAIFQAEIAYKSIDNAFNSFNVIIQGIYGQEVFNLHACFVAFILSRVGRA